MPRKASRRSAKSASRHGLGSRGGRVARFNFQTANSVENRHSGARQRVRARRGQMTGSARARNPEYGFRACAKWRIPELRFPNCKHSLAAQCARVVDEFSAQEGVGNAGCPWHPQPRVHFVTVERTRVTTSTLESPDVPARNGLTVSFALPGDRALFATVISGYVLSKPGWADLESRNFERAIKRQFWRRLKWIVRKSVLAFQSYNSGFTRIDRVDDIGMLRWCLTGVGVCNVVQKHAN